jgi:hypothetical protein
MSSACPGARRATRCRRPGKQSANFGNQYLLRGDCFGKKRLAMTTFYTRLVLVCYVIASVSQRSNPLKTKRLLRQKAPRNDYFLYSFSVGLLCHCERFSAKQSFENQEIASAKSASQ